ncbi:SURF1 family protein [Luteimonas sp. RIT-PG2_3]
MTRRIPLAFGWTLALLAMVAFASLGKWQLGRMHEKQAMLDAVESTLAQRAAAPLDAALDPAHARGYDWVRGEGHFVDAPAVLLDNQQREGRPGVRAYRLFQPDGEGLPVLVELGWLPLPADRTMPAIALPAGEQLLEGLLMPRPSGGIVTAVAAPEPKGGVLTIGLDAANLPALLRQPALATRVLKLDPEHLIGYARDLDILPNTLPPEKHLGYAVQWFGLAIAVLVTALILTFRKSRR